MNVTESPLVIGLHGALGVQFKIRTNTDLRPTQELATIVQNCNRFEQFNACWGIQPSWSKTLIINAKAETVLEKPTFKQAIIARRCLIPVSGWYEWREEGKLKKQKYLFRPANADYLLMAGIYYQGDENQLPQLVTLTTSPTEQCAPYHSRMPLLVSASDVAYWFQSTSNELPALLHSVWSKPLIIQAA